MKLRQAAAAGAIFVALVATGCGFGEGEEIGTAELRVTRDYGRDEMLPPVTAEISESDTVLRLTDREAEITTRYSGAFVQSIDGVEGGNEGSRLFDWFYSVNGVEPSIGAADYELGDGDRVWWDHRDWTAAMRVPANVGSYPEPFLHGYGGEVHPVVVECLGGGDSCDAVGDSLEGEGVELTEAGGDDAIRVLVGPWERVRVDTAAALIEDGPQASGVFADFVPRAGGWRLIGLDQRGQPATSSPGGAGLVAATRRGEAPPTWVVTGTDRAGVRAAARTLDEESLAGRYALAAPDLPLPVR